MSAAEITEQFRVPVDSIEQLGKLGYSRDEIHALVAPRRTLQRRIKENALLSLEESDRVERLRRITERAEMVFGKPEKAQRWLRKSNRALDGIAPIALLHSESGAYKVDEILGRIQFGMFS